MANIRANCPFCGQVDMRPEAVSLQVEGDGDRGEYAFTCPSCSTDVTRSADRKVVALLLGAGVGMQVAPAAPEPPALPAEDQTPRPEAPAFTLDDVIDLHFLLEDDEWLAEALSLQG